MQAYASDRSMPVSSRPPHTSFEEQSSHARLGLTAVLPKGCGDLSGILPSCALLIGKGGGSPSCWSRRCDLSEESTHARTPRC